MYQKTPKNYAQEIIKKQFIKHQKTKTLPGRVQNSTHNSLHACASLRRVSEWVEFNAPPDTV